MNLKPSERSPKPFRPSLLVPANVSRKETGKRRSNRMALNARVALSGQDRQKSPFTMMPARATNLNRHGAAVQLNRELLVGSNVVVQNQRGTVISARVVAQLAALQGVPTFAIEFLDQNDKAKNFWGITFPTNS
jgi:hypothetical protein